MDRRAGARAAEEAGRDPSEVKVMCCAPAHVGDDMADSCEQVRWFPAMVSNHVFDVLSKHDPADLPPALTDYVSRMQREPYDYSEHSRVGAKHGDQITDETCERFCILGPSRRMSRSSGGSRPPASTSGTST